MKAEAGNQPAAIRVDVCICTFRRVEVEDTIRSVAAATVPDNAVVRIVVADNDLMPSARSRVERLAAEIPFELHYIHAPAQNISIARNACLDASTGDFVAFIDDDETASAEWLTELVTTAMVTDADVVLGPVKALYGTAAPGWMRHGDFHSTFPVWVKGAIRTGYTCNVLLRRAAPAVAGRRFSLSLGQSGGEDTEFFSKLHGAGGSIDYAPDAWVYEPVPEGRARFFWLTKRRFRVGQTHGRLLGATRQGFGRISQIGLAAAKAAYCFAVGAGVALLPQYRNRYALRGVMHAGVVSGLLGVREIRQYGEIEPVGGRGNAA